MSEKRASNVRRLKRMRCPCGWYVPLDVTIAGMFPVGKVVLSFHCPGCGRGLEMSGGKLTWPKDDGATGPK